MSTVLAAPAIESGPRRRFARRLRSGLVLLLLVAVWATMIRPEALGGATGYVMVSGRSMEPLLHDGDFVLTRKRDSYRPGDVIAYRIPAGDAGAGAMVIHRVTSGSSATGYVTLGDNRDTEDLWRPKDADVIGRMVLRVPAGGRWLGMVRSPLAMATLAALLVVFCWSPPLRRLS